MVTTEVAMMVAKQHLDIPRAAIQEWIEALTPDILHHKRTSRTVVQFYLKVFAVQYRKLQHAYPNAKADVITPVAIARTTQKLSTSAVISEHADCFTQMWQDRMWQLQSQENQLVKTNPSW